MVLLMVEGDKLPKAGLMRYLYMLAVMVEMMMEMGDGKWRPSGVPNGCFSGRGGVAATIRDGKIMGEVDL